MDGHGIQQAKAELLRRAGHGARNCLNGVVGLAELFRRPTAAPDPAACAAITESAAELKSLLQPLIDIAIADPGTPNPPTAIPIRLLLQEVAAFHDLLGRGRLIRVACDVAEAVAPTLRADRLNFSLLLHLLTARIVAACAEGGQVRIVAEAEGPGLRLTVTGTPSAAAGRDGAAPVGDGASVDAGFLQELLVELGASATTVDLQGTVAIRVTLASR